MQLVLVAFENRKVKLFEAETGHFQFEFVFEDKTLDQLYSSVTDGQQNEGDAAKALSPSAGQTSARGTSVKRPGSARRGLSSTHVGGSSVSPEGMRS